MEIILKLTILIINQLKMKSAMRFRIAKIYEKKCNFCFQWSESSIPIKAPLFCCDSCFQNLSVSGLEVQTAKGQFFGMQFIQNMQQLPTQKQTVQNNLESLINYDVQQTYLRWSRIQSIFDENDYTNQEIQTISEKIEQFHRGHEFQAENLMEYIRNINLIKGKASLDISTEENKEQNVYQSLIENKKENRSNACNLSQVKRAKNQPQSILKHNRLEDYCKNLGATRFIKKYQYYFNTSELKRYQQDAKPTKTREFGAQLSPNKLFLSNAKDQSSKKQQFNKIKFNRSFSSHNSNDKQLRLTEDELKLKIVTFLENGSQSITMNRLMATFVREAYLRTNLQGTMIQLVSFKITNMDLLCYFHLFDLEAINTLKLINVGLTDHQLHTIVDLIATKGVQRLVLTGNVLTEGILQLFLNKSLPNLKQIYLGKNRINKYRMKENISELRSKFILYL